MSYGRWYTAIAITRCEHVQNSELSVSSVQCRRCERGFTRAVGLHRQRRLTWKWSALPADGNDNRWTDWISEGRESTWTVVYCLRDHQQWFAALVCEWTSCWPSYVILLTM